MYTYPFTPAEEWEDRGVQFVNFGVPQATVDMLKSKITDMWIDGPGGWVYEWSAIAADYAATEQQLKAIAAHLRRSNNKVYSQELMKSDKIPAPSPQLMLAVLQAIAEDHGGINGWLAAQGWTADDATRLRAALLE